VVRHSGDLGLTGKPGGVIDGSRPHIVMAYYSQDSLDVHSGCREDVAERIEWAKTSDLERVARQRISVTIATPRQPAGRNWYSSF
jgi:hypothetical protein